MKELKSRDPGQMLKDFFIIILVVSISFLPPPLMLKYHLGIKIFLALAFLIVLLQKRSALFRPSDLPLWIFLLTLSFNVFFAHEKEVALRTYGNLALPLFFIYYFVSESLTSQNRVDLFAKVLCLSCLLVSLLGIIETVFTYNPIYAHFVDNKYYLRYNAGILRPTSTQFNPTPLGAYILGCVPFCFFLLKRTKGAWKSLAGVALVLGITVMALTFSRSAFFGLMVVSLFYLLAVKKYLKTVLFFLGLVLFIVLMSFMPYPFDKLGVDTIFKDGIVSTYKLENRSGRQYPVKIPPGAKDPGQLSPDLKQFTKVRDGIFSPYRMERLSMALRIFRDHPFAGIGFEHFRIRFHEYYAPKIKVPYDARIADNMYLTLLAETGMVGFLGFFVFIFMLLKRGWQKLRQLKPDAPEKWALLVSLMAFAGLLFDMGGFEFLYWPNPYLLFCVVAGSIAASLKAAQ